MPHIDKPSQYAPETVVLLHVLFSSHLEWKEVWPKLTDCHLLVPDLPCHSKSKGACRRDDFSVETCVEHVADMIREHAHDGRAHVVGISSLGGWSTMELARKYPELVRSALVSGAWPLDGYRATIATSPRLVYSGLWSLLHSPAGKKKFFQLSGLSGEYYNDELFHEIKGNCSSRLARAGFACHGWGYDWLGEVGRSGVRMGFVIAGAHDSHLHGLRAGQCIHAQENGDASVYVIPGAAHAWNLQLPALFARSIQCWVNQWPMPTELEELRLSKG